MRVVVTLDGDTLDVEDLLSRTVAGTHERCTGFVDAIPVSSTHFCLRCRHCGLRVTVPFSVRTAEDLRQHFGGFYHDAPVPAPFVSCDCYTGDNNFGWPNDHCSRCGGRGVHLMVKP